MRARYDAPIPGQLDLQSARSERRHEEARMRRAAMGDGRGWVRKKGYSVSWTFDVKEGDCFFVLLQEDTRALKVPHGVKPQDFVKEVRRERKAENLARKLQKELPKPVFSAPRSRL